MKYVITNDYDETLTFEFDAFNDRVEVGFGREDTVSLTIDQFKQLRRAVGYVWTEIEHKED